ncbi:MAG: AAA family ATPase [Candidatus Pacearchaeota archaeon]
MEERVVNLEEQTYQENFKNEVLSFLNAIKKVDPTFSQSRLATMAGISPAALSSVLSGKYTGDVEAIAKKIKAVIEREKEKALTQIKKPTFVRTSVYEQMSYVMNIAQADAQIVVFTGDAGIGKTVSLKAYLEENPSAILIETDPTYTVGTILEELAIALGIEMKGRKDRLEKAIIAKLKGSERMIIVDEAEYLPTKALDILRRIHDKAEIPVVLAGMDRLIYNITGTNDKYKQISSRMYHVKVKSLNKDDVKAITSTVLENLSDEIVNLLFAITKGNARALSKLLIMAQRVAFYNKTQISISVIKKAAEKLILA